MNPVRNFSPDFIRGKRGKKLKNMLKNNKISNRVKKINLIKTSLIIIVLVGIFGLGTSIVWAVDITGKLTNVAGQAGFQDEDPNIATTIGTIIKGFLSLLGIVFMGYVIYAGQLWMTARGNEEQIIKAKAIIRGSIIGIIIIFAAYAITDFVISRAITASNYSAPQTQGGDSDGPDESGYTSGD